MERSLPICCSSAVQQEVADLAAACGAELECVEARPSSNQRGLFATKDVKKEEALFYVPLAVRPLPNLAGIIPSSLAIAARLVSDELHTHVGHTIN